MEHISSILKRVRDDEFEEDEDEFVQQLLFEPLVHQKKKPQREMIDRGREAGHAQLVKDYFTPGGHGYKPQHFERRFRMTQERFINICEDLMKHNRYWIQKRVCIQVFFLFAFFTLNLHSECLLGFNLAPRPEVLLAMSIEVLRH